MTFRLPAADGLTQELLRRVKDPSLLRSESTKTVAQVYGSLPGLEKTWHVFYDDKHIGNYTVKRLDTRTCEQIYYGEVPGYEFNPDKKGKGAPLKIIALRYHSMSDGRRIRCDSHPVEFSSVIPRKYRGTRSVAIFEDNKRNIEAVLSYNTPSTLDWQNWAMRDKRHVAVFFDDVNDQFYEKAKHLVNSLGGKKPQRANLFEPAVRLSDILKS